MTGVWAVNAKGLGNDWYQGNWAMCRMRGVQEKMDIMVAWVNEFDPPPGEGPPVFSHPF